MSWVPVRNSAWLGILSPRQAEVLEQLAAGRTNQQIADSLGLGLETVRQHVEDMYAKLDLAEHGPTRTSSPRVLAARWWIAHVENGAPHETRKHRLLNYFGCHKP